MEGGFQKSLQLFVANRYCVFEDDVCVYLLDVLDGKSDYTNVPFSKLFARARCPPILVPFRVVVIKVYGCEEILQAKRLRHFLSLFCFVFFFLSVSSVWFLESICNGSILVV